MYHWKKSRLTWLSWELCCCRWFLLTKSRFVWSFLSYCSDRLELRCHELSPQNSCELRRISRTSTINSQTGVERGAGWAGDAAFSSSAPRSLWNLANLPLHCLPLPPTFPPSLLPLCFCIFLQKQFQSLKVRFHDSRLHIRPGGSAANRAARPLDISPPSPTTSCWTCHHECAVNLAPLQITNGKSSNS